MRYLLIALLAVGGCSKRDAKPAATSGSSSGVAETLPPGRHLAFVPDSLAARVGERETLFAIDFRALKPNPLLRLIPPQFACAAKVAETIGVLVLLDAEPFTVLASHVNEATAMQCLEEILKGMGGTVTKVSNGSYQVKVGSSGATFVWDAGVLTFQQAGAPTLVARPADAKLLDLAEFVPPKAFGFVFMKQAKGMAVGDVVMSMEVEGDIFVLSGRGVEAKPGEGKKFFDALVKGFSSGFTERGVHVDDSWFENSVDGHLVKWRARVPISVFTSARAAGQDGGGEK